MTISCRNFAIRVSGLGDEWFTGPLPEVSCKLFDGFTADDVEWIGGESHITETVGLGGFAQAAAFGLQAYQGGSAQEMARMTELDVRDHRRRAPGFPDPLLRLPRLPGRHRHLQGRRDRDYPCHRRRPGGQDGG